MNPLHEDQHLRQLIDDIYTEISIERLGLSKKQFSKEFLGKSASYYSYLHCTDSQPSVNVIIYLLRHLRNHRKICERIYENPRNDIQQHFMHEWIEFYSKLEEKVSTAINEYLQKK